MQTKHTPGPWAHYPGDRYIRDPKTDATIAFVCPDDGHCDEPQYMPWEDNARLIASAPDLLAALEAVLKYLPDYDRLNYEFRDAVSAARAAIAKAKGGE